MNDVPVCALRSPTCHETISLESASIAVHVHTSPALSGAALANLTFLFLAYEKLQISSHWTLFEPTFLTVLSWNAAQAWPASMSSLVTVFKDTSHTRVIDRID